MQSDPARKSGAQQKQAAAWLTPQQVEDIRGACLSDAFPNYLQGRNETIIAMLADTGLRVSELVALDWDHVDLNADPPELYLSGGLQKGTKRDAYLDLEDETARQLRRYRNSAWKVSKAAVFPSRQSDRISKTSVRRLVKKAVEEAVFGRMSPAPVGVIQATFRRTPFATRSHSG